MEHICPLCKGAGKIERLDPVVEKKRLRAIERAHAFSLKNEGYTVRKIAEILGYKHPGSITHLLKPEQ